MSEETLVSVGPGTGPGPVDDEGANGLNVAPRPNAAADGPLSPLGLTAETLEALLFVAEKPLSRREIASLAGIDRETVDGLLGDLEVALRERVTGCL